MSADPDQSVQFDGRAFCRRLTAAPGVYRMLNARGEVLKAHGVSSPETLFAASRDGGPGFRRRS